MPDHHLHAYFRFLVDHKDLLQPKDKGQSGNEEKTSNTENAAGAGALSLLGSLYGTGEEEDAGVEHASSSKENESENPVDIGVTNPTVSGKSMPPAGKEEPVPESSLPSKEESPVFRRKSLTNALKAVRTSGIRKGDSSGALSTAPDKLRASSLPPIPKTERVLLEPASDIKRLVDKIVEFIIKNGRQFEAVLMEQDRGHGRFPFLTPSNKYHPYYLQVLQKAQESKLTVKSFPNEKEEFKGHFLNKKTSISKESKARLMEYADLPLDSERKEKFKMVINKSKKEGSDLPSKSTQQQLGVQVDAAQVAAILQAATRGIKHPNLGILSKTSLNGNNYGPSSEGGQPSDSFQPNEAIAKNAVKEVANEADSSDAHLTHEQKLKAERLKRAKMFLAMVKSGAAPSKIEPSRGLSAEPQGSGASGLGADVNLAAKEREGSSAPLHLDTSDKKLKSVKDHLNDERRAKRKYRARSSRHEQDETAEEEENDDDAAEEEENDDDEGKEKRPHKHRSKKHRSRNSLLEDESEVRKASGIDYKHGKRRHRSHRSSHKHDDNDESNVKERDYKYSKKTKHRSPSSSEDEEEEHERAQELKHSRKKHRSHHSSHDDVSPDEVESDDRYSRKKHSSREEDDGRDERRYRRKHRSHRSSHHSRDRHKHRKGHSSSRYRHKSDVSSEEERRDLERADKHVKESHSEREELEEGEISSKISGQSRVGCLGDAASREPSVEISSSYQDQRLSTQPSEATEVPDDLRAKIRAMLMSTL